VPALWAQDEARETVIDERHEVKRTPTQFATRTQKGLVYFRGTAYTLSDYKLEHDDRLRDHHEVIIYETPI